MSYLFTSESVSAGHPDKICDQISDSILDRALAINPNSRVAVETVASGKQIHVLGEINGVHLSKQEVKQIVIDTIFNVGYTPDSYGANFINGEVVINPSIGIQSADISHGVESSFEYRRGSDDAFDLLGAGDQGIMFGHATNELSHSDSSFMPAAIRIAHEIARHYNNLRKTRPNFWPDAKTQVTLKYDGAGKPVEIDTVLVSAQHDPLLTNDEIRFYINTLVVRPVLSRFDIPHDNVRIITNPSGRFVIGGPIGDAGLTGRKIVVDTYGGYAPHGGGAFSGKDPSKVDRSAAYAARWVAKNLVANGMADRATVQLSYAIGMAHPVSVNVKSSNPSNDASIEKLIEKRFDLRPAAIIERLGLNKFNSYKSVAAYGHFGRDDLNLPWEETISL